jgi:ribosomal protein S16
MIEIRADLKGIPFFLIIDGKNVVYERRNIDGTVIEKVQWFPPLPGDKKVLTNISPEEYAQWHACRTESEVIRMIKFDLMKNGCRFEEKII